MTLGSAMNMAMTGLSVSARLAELVSTNVANATTAGFVRREAEVSALVLGGQGRACASAQCGGTLIPIFSRNVAGRMPPLRRPRP
ncbi:hypothetical protein ACFSHQ_05695 [Gemmobacter lanyuensis]